MERVLVAGATGELGRHVVAALQARGCQVRVLSRSRERAAALGVTDIKVADATRPWTLDGAYAGVGRVFSCLGQSVSADMRNRGPGYHAVDYIANHNLLETARQAGVKRFVYVSVLGADARPEVAYLKAHADVATELRRSGLGYAVVQPTGFFSAYAAFLAMARGGRAVVFGDGRARTNPIHDADLAAVCADAVLSDTDQEVAAGGPDILTRRQVAELAFKALGRPAKIVRAPAWAPAALGALMRPLAPRVGELMAFLGAVSREDFVAPVRGSRRLEAYYRELAGRGRNS